MFTRTYELISRDQNGYSQLATLQLANIRSNHEGLAVAGFPAGSVCNIDGQKDAFVPALVTITNTTDGFDNDLILEFVGNPPVSVLVEGPSGCDDTYFELFPDVAPGQSIEVGLFFILRGFYSPSHPEGDLAMARKVKVIFAYPCGACDVFSLSGPGANDAAKTVPLVD